LKSLVCIEPRAVPLKMSGVPTCPLDGVTFISMWYKYFKVFELNIFFSHAITRAGFDSQLTLNCQGLLFGGKGLLAGEVRPIQTIREYFQPNKKARVLERACIMANKGANRPIFEGNMLPKNVPLFRAPLTAQ
jgi:hypothetical protein